MALISCSECGNQISDKAAYCPHCGAPLGNDTKPHHNQYNKGPMLGSEETFMGRFFIFAKILVKCGILLLVVFYIAPFFFSNNIDPLPRAKSSGSSNQVSRPKVTSMKPIAAQELTNIYAKNAVAADQQFKGDWILVEGDIENIKTGVNNDAYVMFNVTEHSWDAPKATFIKAENNKLASLSKGQHIMVLCIGDGVMLGSPLLDKCTLVD
ncbi:zinc-ribbon domain-containing protein [Edwardsiella piscicida]|uniref:OB-fold protein n=1 Tax=Edwardsiella piscicida TaxID=1263550 RepID=UPI0015E81321|nr:zinc-ribbon domain-containing protein [Edwardsiella piscicida]EKS7766373.1 zinc-ribbon domain-containing protein [Edwardsiella piscicida]UCQ43786.1 zinc-ribbon domain-containing protein [Edwardsiella piscicida]